MKNLILLLALAVFAACNNNTDNPTEEKVDSINKRTDTLQDRVDSTKDAKIDSVKEWSKEQKEKFDSSAKVKKDSIKGKKSK